MSQRSWEAEQSAQIELADGVYPVVTQEDLAKALLDAAVVLSRAGGHLYVAQQRIPTGKPHEFVTTQATVLWQDRTDAKPQTEPDARAEGQVAPLEEVGEPPQQPAVDALGPDQANPAAPVRENDPTIPRPADPTPFDDGLSVDPEAVDESDPELRAATSA